MAAPNLRRFSIRLTINGAARLLINLTLGCLIVGCSRSKEQRVDALLTIIKEGARGPDDFFVAVQDVNSAGLGNLAAPRIINLLDDDNPNVRRSSVVALGGVGADGPIVIPPLLARRHDPRLRGLVIQALGKARPTNDSVIEALIEAAKDKKLHVRLAAIDGLRGMGPIARKAVPILIEALDSPEYNSSACDALGDIGPEARAAIPRLRKTVTTDDHYTRIQGARALLKIEGNTDFVVSALIDLLKCDDGYARREAARTLGDIGPRAHDAIPALQHILDQPPKGGSDINATPPPPGVVRMRTEEEAYPELRAVVIQALTKIKHRE
jgi:HEAT repeat protein